MTSVIRFEHLSCGMPVCLQSSDESRLLSISVWINAGSARDPVGKEGLAHLGEHLLMRPLTLAESQARLIQLKAGALVNAYTDTEWLSISVQAPVEQSRLLINLLVLLLREPCVDPNGMEAEKNTILQELQEIVPGSGELLSKIFHESAFSDNPSTHAADVTSKTLDAILACDVQNFYSHFLNTSNIVITAHGGTSVSELTTMLDDAFKDFPETSISPDSPNDESANIAQSRPVYRPVRIHKEISGTGCVSGYKVLAGFSSVPRISDEYWTALAFEVLMADGPESLLSRWLRNERNWMYGAVSTTEAFSTWGNQCFLMDISHERIDEAIEYLGRQWQALSEFLTDERVLVLRNRFASRALSSLSGMQDRMTLMKDTVLATRKDPVTVDGGIENIVTHHVRQLNTDNLLAYVRQYAEWERVSLVCAPVY